MVWDIGDVAVICLIAKILTRWSCWIPFVSVTFWDPDGNLMFPNWSRKSVTRNKTVFTMNISDKQHKHSVVDFLVKFLQSWPQIQRWIFFENLRPGWSFGISFQGGYKVHWCCFVWTLLVKVFQTLELFVDWVQDLICNLIYYMTTWWYIDEHNNI